MAISVRRFLTDYPTALTRTFNCHCIFGSRFQQDHFASTFPRVVSVFRWASGAFGLAQALAGTTSTPAWGASITELRWGMPASGNPQRFRRRQRAKFASSKTTSL